MKLVYILSENDLIPYAAHSWETSNLIQKRLRNRRLMGILSTLLIALAFLLLRMPTLITFFVIIFIAIEYFLTPILLNRSNQRQLVTGYKTSRGMGHFGEVVLEISSDEIVERREFRTTSIRWPQVEKIDSIEGYTFVYISPFEALIIPEAGVIDGDYAEFIQAAMDYFSHTAA